MKTLSTLFILAGMVCINHHLAAQQRLTEEEKQEAIERYMAFQEELNLTDEQKPLVEEINQTYFRGISQMRNSEASRLEKYRTFKDLSATRDRQMKQVLDKEQYKLFKQFQEETRANIRERRAR